MSTTSICDRSETEKRLIETSLERQEKYRYIIPDDFPLVAAFNEKVFLGSFSWTATKSKLRIIPQRAVIRYAGNPVTAPEIARDYLDICYPRRLRASGAQAEAFRRPRHSPLYARPGALRQGAYVDIVSAYWQIMGIMGWDVDYMPGKFIAPGRAPYDFPLHAHKVSRNCLVTAGLSNTITVWTGSKFYDETPNNKHLNLGLMALINDVLNGCAHEAMKCGAIYVNCDGYIVPDDRAELLVTLLRERWGLQARIKHSGPALVTGVGSYQVGDYRTKGLRLSSDPYGDIPPVEGIELLKDMMRMVSRDRVDRPGLFRR